MRAAQPVTRGRNSPPSHPSPGQYCQTAGPISLRSGAVRIAPRRTAALGAPIPDIGPALVDEFADHWIVGLEDITAGVFRLRAAETIARVDPPDEQPYPLPEQIAATIGATAPGPTRDWTHPRGDTMPGRLIPSASHGAAMRG